MAGKGTKRALSRGHSPSKHRKKRQRKTGGSKYPWITREKSPEPLFDDEDDEANDDNDKDAEPTAENIELGKLIAAYPNSVARYVDMQYITNREYKDSDDTVKVILELGCSDAQNQCEHTLWKHVKAAVAAIKSWKDKHDTWKEARKKNGRMPFLKESARLQALRYLNMGSPGYPQVMIDELAKVNLQWLLISGLWTNFWEGARLDDDDWRAANMHPPPKKMQPSKVPQDVAEKVASLLKAVLPKRPIGIISKSRSRYMMPVRPKFGGPPVADVSYSSDDDDESESDKASGSDDSEDEADGKGSSARAEKMKEFIDAAVKEAVKEELDAKSKDRPDAGAITDWQTKVNAMSADIQALQKLIDGLKGSTGPAEGSSDGGPSQEELQQKIDAFETRLKSLMDERTISALNEVNNRVTQVEADVAKGRVAYAANKENTNKRFDQVDQKMDPLQQDVKTLKEKIDALMTMDGAVDGSRHQGLPSSELTTAVDALKKEVTPLKEEVEKLKQDVVGLKEMEGAVNASKQLGLSSSEPGAAVNGPKKSAEEQTAEVIGAIRMRKEAAEKDISDAVNTIDNLKKSAEDHIHGAVAEIFASKKDGKEQMTAAVGSVKKDGEEKMTAAVGSVKKDGEEKMTAAVGSVKKDGEEQMTAAVGSVKKDGEEKMIAAVGSVKKDGEEKMIAAVGSVKKGGEEQMTAAVGSAEKSAMQAASTTEGHEYRPDDW